jgi:ABC-type branched-subunit amino acid transport system permease subunit
MSARVLAPARDTRILLIKWIVALIVPVAVFTFVWSGEQIINAVFVPGTVSRNLPTDPGSLIQVAIFIAVFYVVVIMLAGYLVAADSGRTGMLKLWIEVAVFAAIPLVLIIGFGLVNGLASCVIVWLIFFYLQRRVRNALTFPPPLRLKSLIFFNAEKINKSLRRFVVFFFWVGAAAAVAWALYNFLLLVSGQLIGQRLLLGIGILIGLPIAGALAGAALTVLLLLGDLIIGVVLFVPLYLYLRVRGGNGQSQAVSTASGNVNVSFAEQRAVMMGRATAGGFWFATTLALVWLFVDLVFYFSGSLPSSLLIWVVVRTIALPILGYFLGMVGGLVALRRTRGFVSSGNRAATNGGNDGARRAGILGVFSNGGGNGHVKSGPADVVPNDLPMRSTGATRFYLILLVAFVLFFPVLDPFLFGFGSDGRITQYGDAGYYVILALGLNIVVGFAGLLDLGYVAFFAIGAYVWGIIGSPQIGFLITSIHVNPTIWPWLFWPFLIIAALVAAFFGVLLGAPTLRLRGDYLAIVTLGFGEIVPIVFLELDNITKGANGLPGIYSPAFPGVLWNGFTPIPYYYLILALIAFTIFTNIRLRDSRMGRAWIAIREDEIAASSSGINLVNTKLLAFGTGAFFSGIAGAFHAAKLGIVSPDAFSFGDSIIYLAMVVIGGIGSIPGVIVGALLVYSVNELILANLDTIVADPTAALYPILNPIYQVLTHIVPGFTFGNIRNLVFGIVLVVIMIFRPEGLIPSARRRRELHSLENEPAEAEMSSLDVAPGSPDFEAEVRVE